MKFYFDLSFKCSINALIVNLHNRLRNFQIINPSFIPIEPFLYEKIRTKSYSSLF